jgi:hypothetical protein
MIIKISDDKGLFILVEALAAIAVNQIIQELKDGGRSADDVKSWSFDFDAGLARNRDKFGWYYTVTCHDGQRYGSSIESEQSGFDSDEHRQVLPLMHYYWWRYMTYDVEFDNAEMERVLSEMK